MEEWNNKFLSWSTDGTDESTRKDSKYSAYSSESEEEEPRESESHSSFEEEEEESSDYDAYVEHYQNSYDDSSDGERTSSSTKPTCKWLMSKGLCYSFSCKYDHSDPTILRCKYVDAKNGCYAKGCKLQHPNPKNTSHLQFWTTYKGSDIEKRKANAKYRSPIVLKPYLCPEYKKNKNCADPSCDFQHKVESHHWKVGKRKKPKHPDGTLLPARKGDEAWVRRIVHQRAPGQITIHKVEEVVNAKLVKGFRTRKAEIKSRIGRDPCETEVFHGTDSAAVLSIVKNGFDPSKQRRAAYGKGQYFARSPAVAKGYAGGRGQMLFCKVLMGQEGMDSIYVPSQQYFVITDANVRGCRPLFVITFS